MSQVIPRYSIPAIREFNIVPPVVRQIVSQARAHDLALLQKSEPLIAVKDIADILSGLVVDTKV